MANPFLSEKERDIETAIMLEQAVVHDIGKAVAFTDGKRIFINTEDNLFNIFPDYNHGMLKWLLWHEKMHLELRHHKRYFKYLKELELAGGDMLVSKEEVNIIMDILVHDSLARMFPDLVDTAVNNLAQMRNRNSLQHTFKTFTLEEMLKELADTKDPEKDKEESKDGKPDSEGEETKEEADGEAPGESKKGDGESEHREGGHSESESKGKDEKEPEIKDEEPPAPEPEPEHDKTDWSKLEERDTREFIDSDDGEYIMRQVEKLKRKKFKLAKLTETLNGLVTSTRRRTYSMPSTVHIGHGVMLKGSTPGRTQLYLCFDASGSMGREMETFKEIISKSIPQAMDTPTTWFSGYGERVSHDPAGRNRDYYKGKFKDFMPVRADSGYSDDGDRTIELCFKAEQMGYSPIGVTDGGGQISWSKDMLKQLKRTVLVGQNKYWLDEAKKINPKIQILDID